DRFNTLDQGTSDRGDEEARQSSRDAGGDDFVAVSSFRSAHSNRHESDDGEHQRQRPQSGLDQTGTGCPERNQAREQYGYAKSNHDGNRERQSTEQRKTLHSIPKRPPRDRKVGPGGQRIELGTLDH